MSIHAQNVVVLNRESSQKPSDCQFCMKRAVCPVFESGSPRTDPARNEKPLMTPFQKNTRAGQTVVDAGEEFNGIYLVRSGFFKSYFIDSDGVMQVTGFFFPGEIFGIDGIESGRYRNIVEALDTGSVCRLPLSSIAEAKSAGNSRLEKRTARNQTGGWNTDTLLSLMKVMSGTIARDRDMIYALGKLCAKRRFASFLLDVAGRMERSGYSRDEFRLCMSRNDISNYLCLAVETISRLFTQFQSLGIINVVRRELGIVDMNALRAIAETEEGGELLLEKAS